MSGAAHGEGGLGLPDTILIYFHFANAGFAADCLLKFSVIEGSVKLLGEPLLSSSLQK